VVTLPVVLVFVEDVVILEILLALAPEKENAFTSNSLAAYSKPYKKFLNAA
jgi:hypothetical protein